MDERYRNYTFHTSLTGESCGEFGTNNIAYCSPTISEESICLYSKKTREYTCTEMPDKIGGKTHQEIFNLFHGKSLV
jgi:hypothetical protein